MNTKLLLSALLCSSLFALGACEKQGAMEKAGEEVDEAVDTMKRGGDESVGTKMDDTMDKARDTATKAKEEVKEAVTPEKQN